MRTRLVISPPTATSTFAATNPHPPRFQIRNKRLAKLANPSLSPAEGTSDSASTSSPSQSSYPSQHQAEPHTTPVSAMQTPPQAEGNRINITPAAPSPNQPRPSAARPSGTPPTKPEESIEAFEDRTLSAVFKLTLKEDRQRDIHGQRFIYLPGLRSELQDEGKELLVQTAVLDQALLEAASTEKQRPLDYLMPCWKRVSRLHKSFRKAREDDPKFQVLCEARRLCMSYCIFAITMPEMFGYAVTTYSSFFPHGWDKQPLLTCYRFDSTDQSPLARYLLLDPEDDRGVDFDFMSEAVKRFDEDDTIKPAFIAAVEGLSSELSSKDLNDDYKPYATVCLSFTIAKSCANHY